MLRWFDRAGGQTRAQVLRFRPAAHSCAGQRLLRRLLRWQLRHLVLGERCGVVRSGRARPRRLGRRTSRRRRHGGRSLKRCSLSHSAGRTLRWHRLAASQLPRPRAGSCCRRMAARQIRLCHRSCATCRRHRGAVAHNIGLCSPRCKGCCCGRRVTRQIRLRCRCCAGRCRACAAVRLFRLCSSSLARSVSLPPGARCRLRVHRHSRSCRVLLSS